MWRCLGDALGARDETYAAAREATLEAGVALWDVLSDVHAPGVQRRPAKRAAPNDLAGFLRAHPSITTLAFNGSKARAAFAHHFAADAVAARSVLGGRPLNLVDLPSTSRANTRLPRAAVADAYRSCLAR